MVATAEFASVPLDPALIAEITRSAETIDGREDFDPYTVRQAQGYIEKVDVDSHAKAQLINLYGVLREGLFPVPPDQAENARFVNTLCDQKLFSLALLLCGKRKEFDTFIHLYPNIFDVRP